MERNETKQNITLESHYRKTYIMFPCGFALVGWLEILTTYSRYLALCSNEKLGGGLASA
jgi:hypothetical protein